MVTRTAIGIGGVVTLNKRWILSAIMGTLALTIVGCSPAQFSENQTPSDSNNVTHPQVVVSKKPLDGASASIQQVNTYESYTGTNIRLYKIFYWSNGYKVEAFLTEPTKPGKYPLLINLHGGYGYRRISHYSFGYTAQQAAQGSNPHIVELYPEYQGYMGSQGPVMGLKTDMADITNAIMAAKSLGEIKSNDTYVEGYSVGGALALMTAARDREVKAVVAVSPLVGLTDYVKWAQSNAKPGTAFFNTMVNMQTTYGEDTNSLSYKERSPDVQKIEAPVLLLQGTADKSVPWQTVQIFANQMKAANKTEKFILYKGGQHGLHTAPYQSESHQLTIAWFAKYGLNLQS